MTDYKFLTFEKRDNIGILTINREAKLNALNQDVLTELKDFFKSAKELGCNSVILTGAGHKAFIAGADIDGMGSMDVKEGEEFAALGQSLTIQIEELSIPVIAAVNGYALGGGLEMALACDFIYATENAVFGLPEVSLGLIPGFGGTQRLAKIVGRHRAKEYIYTGRSFKIDEAKEIGLVNKVFADKDELIEGAIQTLQKVEKNSPFAVGMAKKVLNKGVDYGNKDGLKFEKEQFGRLFESFDMKEGTQAFMEKRKPEFRGE